MKGDTNDLGNGKVLVPFGHFLSPADGLGFSKEPFMYLASMTSCTTDPGGIFAKIKQYWAGN